MERTYWDERGEREDEKFDTVIEKKLVNEILCDKKEQKKDFNRMKTVKIFLWDGNKQGISELENPIWRKIILSTFDFFFFNWNFTLKFYIFIGYDCINNST